MKASLKLREDRQHHQNQNQNPLLRAKIPISILGLPFMSGITAGDPTDLSFNLRTNYLNGPSLKLSYSPTTNTATTSSPFSLSLKSGVGFFGSPHNSPLIMSAHFNLFGNHNPTFSLQIKPQFGDFSLKKTAVSASLPNPTPNPNLPKENGGVHFNDGGVMPERPLVWRDLMEFEGGGDGFFSGVAVMAKTVLPVTKRAVMKFRWGVNFPTDYSGKKRIPFLTVDKIGIEHVEEEVKLPLSKNNGRDGGDVGDLEVLKGMCHWMRTEMEVLQRENRAMKESLDGLRLGSPARNRCESESVSKKSFSPSTENSSEFDRWRNKKNGREENGRREMKKSSGSESPASDVGEELKRAIKAASSNGV